MTNQTAQPPKGDGELSEHKQNLLKTYDHLDVMVQMIDDLQNEVMPPSRYAHKMKRLRDHAAYARQRFFRVVSKETNIVERMEFKG